MKRGMIVMGALMISSVIFAQTKEKGHRHGEGQLEKFKSELSLNDTQYASIKGINKKYADQFLSLRKDSTTAKTEKHAALKKLRDEKEKEINAVLTTDQKTNYERLKAERAAKRKAQVQARGEKRQAQMAKDLSLTDEQTSKLNVAHKAFMEKAKNLREKSGSDKESGKAEIKALRKEHEESMKSILTADQFNKWKEMKKSNRAKHNKGRRK